MNREEYEKSLEGLSEEKKAELLKHFDDQQELVKNESHLKQIIKERDEAKNRLKALEDAKAKAEADAKAKQGEFQSLYEETKVKAEGLEKTVAELNSYKEKYTKVETDRRNELLAQLPEADEELKKVATKITDLEDLKEFVTVAISKLGKKTVDGGRGGKGKVNVDGKSWDDFTFKERQELFVSNREAYDQLYRKKYNIK